MRNDKRLAGALGLALPLAVAATALGHANFRPKDIDPLYDGRSYKEGTTQVLLLSAAHGCSGSPTTEVYAVFPNSTDLSGLATGNALMAIRPEVNESFKTIARKRGPVPLYVNHGEKTDDIRAIHWTGGRIPDDMYVDLHFSASLPRLEGCVERLRVFVPTVQYCKNGMEAWMRAPTPSFPEGVISAGYAPFVDVVRDYDNNPLPATCTEGETHEVYPSEQDIERYLTRR